MQTGLGDRVATFFVKILGKSTLGLSYGLTISEALLAPAMPSTTARAGGRAWPLELLSAQPDCLLALSARIVSRNHNHRILLPGLATRSQTVCSYS